MEVSIGDKFLQNNQWWEVLDIQDDNIVQLVCEDDPDGPVIIYSTIENLQSLQRKVSVKLASSRRDYWVSPDRIAYKVDVGHEQWAVEHFQSLFKIDEDNVDDIEEYMISRGWTIVSGQNEEFYISGNSRNLPDDIKEMLIYSGYPIYINDEKVVDEEDKQMKLGSLKKKADKKKSIVVDFDGTIIIGDNYPEMGEVNTKLVERLREAQSSGYEIIIHSCRWSTDLNDEETARKNKSDVLLFLQENDIPFDQIYPSNKPAAMWYIDDKAINAIEFAETGNVILKKVAKKYVSINKRYAEYKNWKVKYNGSIYPADKLEYDSELKQNLLYFYDDEDNRLSIVLLDKSELNDNESVVLDYRSYPIGTGTIIKMGASLKKVAQNLEENDPVKEYIDFHNIIIGLEWLKGDIRVFTDSDFSIEMRCGYGYVVNTKGEDGAEIDVYVGEALGSQQVFCISQIRDNGDFDEYKYMLGFLDEKEAVGMYVMHQPIEHFGGAENIGIEEFRKIVYTSQEKINKKKEASLKQTAGFKVGDVVEDKMNGERGKIVSKEKVDYGEGQGSFYDYEVEWEDGSKEKFDAIDVKGLKKISSLKKTAEFNIGDKVFSENVGQEGIIVGKKTLKQWAEAHPKDAEHGWIWDVRDAVWKGYEEQLENQIFYMIKFNDGKYFAEEESNIKIASLKKKTAGYQAVINFSIKNGMIIAEVPTLSSNEEVNAIISDTLWYIGFSFNKGNWIYEELDKDGELDQSDVKDAITAFREYLADGFEIDEKSDSTIEVYDSGYVEANKKIAMAIYSIGDKINVDSKELTITYIEDDIYFCEDENGQEVIVQAIIANGDQLPNLKIIQANVMSNPNYSLPPKQFPTEQEMEEWFEENGGSISVIDGHRFSCFINDVSYTYVNSEKHNALIRIES